MAEFNFADLKQQREVFEINTPKFKEFVKDEIAKINPALMAIYEFIQACISYYDVDSQLESGRKLIKEKEDGMEAINTELNESQAAYDKQNEEIELIKGGVDDKVTKEQELENTILLYNNRLERASHLTEGLKLDKNNWITNSKNFELRKKNILGDSILYSAIITHLSCFNKT